MKNLIRSALLCVFTVGAGSAIAQTVEIQAPGGSLTPGQNFSVPVQFTQGATQIGSLDIRINVSNSQFSSISLDCNTQTVGASFNLCSNANAASGEVSIRLSGNGAAQLVTGKLGDISLTVAGGATPNPAEPIDGTVDGVGDVSGDNDLPLNTITVVDDTVNIAGPAYSSNPAAGGGTEFVFGPEQQGNAVPNQILTITNTGIGTLSGTCTETSDVGNVFTITNGSYSAGAGLNDTVTVACDTVNGAINTHTGQFQCTHNAGNVSSPVTYDMSCQITAGPEPAYSSSNPAANNPINLSVTEAGDPNPTQMLTISNSGQGGSTLVGTCSMLAGDSQITLTSGGGFSLTQGATSNKIVSCDASVQGNFSRTLQCTHNGTNIASPVNYAVSCVVPEAGSAVFDSNPSPGSAIDFNNGGDPVVGDTDPTRMLTLFNNADPGDQFLDINCSLSGSPAISVLPDISGGISLAPDGGSQAVTFTCDTDSSGDFTATYSCNYQNGGVEGPAGNGTLVEYPVSCEVREPESQVQITPTPSSPQNKSVPPGGSTSFLFDFTEVNDEGEDALLHNCFLDAGGQGFTITAPSFDASIPSGGTTQVVVSFTDPGGADNWSDTLVCEFSDSDDDDTIVSWPLNVDIGGDARITVLKDFTDGNPGDVTVVLDCNTGLILDQDKDISEDGIGVTFVITDYTAGILDCYVRELPVAGYSADYEASGDSDSTDLDDPNEDAGCYFTDMAGGVENLCQITNSPDPVDVVITKEWVYPGSSDASMVPDDFEILLLCSNAEIDNGDKFCGPAISKGETILGEAYAIDSCKWLEGDGDTTFTESVTPYDWPGGMCWAVEVDVDQAVEVDNGCSSGVEVSAGSGGSCTITNTVFFEGIPTLSQYGMLLMALLMMGVGFVAVRRIS